MAEHIVKLIPCMHTYRTNVKRAESAAAALRRLIPAEDISFNQYDSPEFAGCGEKLTEIRCPRCGAEIPKDWWSAKMDEMFEADHYFILDQEMPCCGKTVSFNNLRYQEPCGFANLVFTIRNPEGEVTEEAFQTLSERFGVLFRKVDIEL